MPSLTQTISTNFREFLLFLKSTDFSKAIIVGIALTLPVVIGLKFGFVEIAIALAFGAFWSSPSDVSGSFKHKRNGILFSILLIIIVSFIGGYLNFNTLLLIPVLGVLTFSISYIAVFGFRASLISFSGLLALVLSFAHDAERLATYEYAFFIGLGGLWYLLLATIWHKINPKGQTEELLTKTYQLTAQFLEIRGKLIDPQSNRETLQKQLLELQADINDNHETLREILISSRKSSGRSIYESKRLLVFVQLIDMLETALANPVHYDKMDQFLSKQPEFVEKFQKLLFEMSNQLLLISEARQHVKKIPSNKPLLDCFQTLKNKIADLKSTSETENYEDFLMLQNLLEYQENQIEKIQKIKWLLANPNPRDIKFIKKDVAKRFVTTQDYNPAILIRNFSFKSAIFKHALRLAVAVMIGYGIGVLFDFQNPYWILLTLIVIMRPSYGLTKTRSKERIIGTLIGGAIAIAVVFITQNTYVYAILGLGSLVIALSMIQKNYKTAATFITLSVVFIYALISPDVLTVIQFRIIDTLIGAGVATLAILFLWPAWEFMDIKSSIEKSVLANKSYLSEIITFYEKKGKRPTSYKLSRKMAFLEMSNLSAAFQRMTQDPKSKQKNLEKVYELVVLNQTFLSSLASLSTYIQNHPTTEASSRFSTAGMHIDENLEQLLVNLKQLVENDDMSVTEQNDFFKRELPQFTIENPDLPTSVHPKLERQFQEAHLIREQLHWLFSISKKMLKLSKTIKLPE
ncbi:FUSC family protein [Marixanthomonas sp. SCSIO 43207]|uniref:FUSC family protein n=1 Tax=Marixanthomonas sp. SCSIO 43207 TaxID=2779360 RepID=UPI001CA812BF|nr:FUSC family membrane protein [Marixanthomonas sp. SCSIO 43207]UAB82054.1 FUSC family protein [Marixanthomonas sp. SCSIO 43207]